MWVCRCCQQTYDSDIRRITISGPRPIPEPKTQYSSDDHDVTKYVKKKQTNSSHVIISLSCNTGKLQTFHPLFENDTVPN